MNAKKQETSSTFWWEKINEFTNEINHKPNRIHSRINCLQTIKLISAILLARDWQIKLQAEQPARLKLTRPIGMQSRRWRHQVAEWTLRNVSQIGNAHWCALVQLLCPPLGCSHLHSLSSIKSSVRWCESVSASYCTQWASLTKTLCK